MYLGAMSRLDDAGYVQYEISNVSRPGLESRHNLKYWSDGEWLGFGCGAHSTRGGTRQKNVASTEDYISAIGEDRSVGSERRVLTDQERFEEAVFTELRLTRGVDLGAIRARYGVDVWDRYGEDLRTIVASSSLLEIGCQS